MLERRPPRFHEPFLRSLSSVREKIRMDESQTTFIAQINYRRVHIEYFYRSDRHSCDITCRFLYFLHCALYRRYQNRPSCTQYFEHIFDLIDKSNYLNNGSVDLCHFGPQFRKCEGTIFQMILTITACAFSAYVFSISGSESEEKIFKDRLPMAMTSHFQCTNRSGVYVLEFD